MTTTAEARWAEIAEKHRRVREYLDAQGLIAVVLQSPNSFAWITGGGDCHVAIGAEQGAATVVITPDRKYLISNNIERPRLSTEEVAGLDFELIDHPWHKGGPDTVLREVLGDRAFASDSGILGSRKVVEDIHRMQKPLTSPEMERYRWLGAACGRILGQVMAGVRPGMSEHEVASMIAGRAVAEGILPAVILVAADERVFSYRHPIPTDRQVQTYVMGVLVGRRWGLHSSESRLVHFGPLSAELEARHAACTRVDAALIASTRPGACVGDIMARAIKTYGDTGFPGEWQLHHQGGASGYAPRTYRGTPSSKEVVSDREAFAWNPSIAGTKSEDTILALADGPEILSTSPNWPTVEVEAEGCVLRRPDILVR